jgi:hypothetical protein
MFLGHNDTPLLFKNVAQTPAIDLTVHPLRYDEETGEVIVGGDKMVAFPEKKEF